jgi:hypothetical protein
VPGFKPLSKMTFQCWRDEIIRGYWLVMIGQWFFGGHWRTILSASDGSGSAECGLRCLHAGRCDWKPRKI